jgi:geranylgeranyl diphosphate synthase type II
MDLQKRIDRNLEQAVTLPPRAVIRRSSATRSDMRCSPVARASGPRLCLAVALAAGDEAPHASNAAATAIELLHCASLVHDDLPCFDDAATAAASQAFTRPSAKPLRC